MSKNSTSPTGAPPTVEGRSRTPNGVDPRPIALRLMPQEREQVAAQAKLRQQTMASFARECFVTGLRVMTAQAQRTPSSAKRSPR